MATESLPTQEVVGPAGAHEEDEKRLHDTISVEAVLVHDSDAAGEQLNHGYCYVLTRGMRSEGATNRECHACDSKQAVIDKLTEWLAEIPGAESVGDLERKFRVPKSIERLIPETEAEG